MTYRVKLEIFEGPLDLLLHLVKQNHLEIDAIPIAVITDQYLKTLELMQALDLEVAGEFLVMAATLMQIKSRMLLPPEQAPAQEEEEPDPALELIERLKEYAKFKQAAELLSGMEKERLVQFIRPAPGEGAPAEVEEYVEASLFDLLTAFSQFMEGQVSREMIQEIICDEHTVEQSMELLRSLTRQQGKASVTELFGKAASRPEAVALFLALLELIRLQEVSIRQSQLFGEIWVFGQGDSVPGTESPTETGG